MKFRGIFSAIYIGAILGANNISALTWKYWAIFIPWVVVDFYLAYKEG